ncbi:MAG: hypothetical protein WCR46_07505 [Deltaproteobacteria bacterium]
MGLVERLKAKFRSNSSDESQDDSSSSNIIPPNGQEEGSFQDDLDALQDGATLQLIPREFPGPVKINRCMILDGQGATIWSLKGPVVSIRSDGVVLRNVRIEVTGENGTGMAEEECALQIEPGRGVHLEKDVEVRGTVIGLPQEEGDWRYPHSLHIGYLAYGMDYEFILRILVPVPCQITSNISGLEIKPRSLSSGANEIHIHMECLPQDTLLYGFLLLTSTFLKRRITFNAHILSKLSAQTASIPVSGFVIWEPENWTSLVAGPQPQPTPPEPIPIQVQPDDQVTASQTSVTSSGNLTPTQTISGEVPPRYPEPQVDAEPQKQTLSEAPPVQVASVQPLQPPTTPSAPEPIVSPGTLPPVSESEKTPSSGIRRIEGAPLSSIFSQCENPSATKPEKKKHGSVSSGSSIIDPKLNDTPISTLFISPVKDLTESNHEVSQCDDKRDEVVKSSAPLQSILVRSRAISGLFEQTFIPNDVDGIKNQTDEEVKVTAQVSTTHEITAPQKKIVRSKAISPLFGGAGNNNKRQK